MHAERIERLRQYVAEGRIIRKAWWGKDEQGRETACLLAALSPEVAAEQQSRACPADVMPPWLATLTPSLDDCTSCEYWPDFVRSYADAAERWRVLDVEAWGRAKARVMIAVLEIAERDDENGVVQAVLGLWRRTLVGGHPTLREWYDARVNGIPVHRPHAQVHLAAAADSAVHAMVSGSSWLTYSACDTASAAEIIGGSKAKSAAWDTIAQATIDAINTECAALEGKQ
jgi:hypothetical protein